MELPEDEAPSDASAFRSNGVPRPLCLIVGYVVSRETNCAATLLFLRLFLQYKSPLSAHGRRETIGMAEYIAVVGDIRQPLRCRRST